MLTVKRFQKLAGIISESVDDRDADDVETEEGSLAAAVREQHKSDAEFERRAATEFDGSTYDNDKQIDEASPESRWPGREEEEEGLSQLKTAQNQITVDREMLETCKLKLESAISAVEEAAREEEKNRDPYGAWYESDLSAALEKMNEMLEQISTLLGE